MIGNIQVGDFFTLLNSIENVDEFDYSKVELIVEVAKAFERSMYQSVYIIDYYKKEFLYVSNNITRLCGEDAKKIKDFGYKFYFDYVPSEELRMLLDINNSGFMLFETFPFGERGEYIISYDFHIKKGNRKRLINHKLTPIVLTKDGKIWLAICIISLASNNKPGNVFIKKPGASTFYEYDLTTKKWNRKDEIVLSDMEREILSLSSQGYTMNEIAGIIFKSIDTVKTYKRNLFSKMEVKNIVEALTYAQNHQLL